MVTQEPAEATMAAGDAGYTTTEIAAVLGMSAAQVRSYARAGLIEPRRGARGEYRFDFRDVVLLRSAGALAQRLSARRVRRALARLKDELPRGAALTDCKIAVQGEDVVVRHDGSTWEPESGQVLLDFEVSELAAKVAPIALANARAARGEAGYSADDWYEMGVELEARAPEDARRAYEHALRIDPEHAKSCINLGRLLHHRGDMAGAAHLYLRALEQRSEDSTAFFNLGVALEDLGNATAAIRAYERAIQVDPTCADAYYNASRLYERIGDRAAALRHLRSYRGLT